MPSAFVARISGVVLEKPWVRLGRLLGAGMGNRATTLARMDEYPSAEITDRGRSEPASGPAALALARGRHGRREGHPDPPERRRAAVLRAARVLRRPRAAPEGRAHVALRGGRQRRDRRGDPRRVDVPRRDARPAHRREGPRAPGRADGRGDDHRALPRAQARARVGDPDAGDLHAARLRRRRRDRHAPADRRHRDRHDRLPVRPDAGPGVLARAAARAGLLRRRDRAGLRVRPGRHPQPARPRHAARRLRGDLRHRHRRAAARRDRRGLDVVGDLRADEALRRGRRGREGPPAPALRRGLRARDDRRRGRGVPRARRRLVHLRAPGEPRVDPPAQRDGGALRDARRAARRARRAASPPRITSRCASGSTAPPEPRAPARRPAGSAACRSSPRRRAR